MEGADVLAKIKAMGKREVETVCSSLAGQFAERNRIMGRASEVACLTADGQRLMDSIQGVASSAVRRSGVSDMSYYMRFMAASLHLMAATLARPYMRPYEYRTLVAAWEKVLPEVTDESGVGLKEEKAVPTKKKTEAQSESREMESPRQLREIKEGKVKGDPSQGVRIKPSVRDHPGLYFLIEAKANRRVYSGYYELREAEEIIKQQGWKNLGMVGSRTRAEEPKKEESVA